MKRKIMTEKTVKCFQVALIVVQDAVSILR